MITWKVKISFLLGIAFLSLNCCHESLAVGATGTSSEKETKDNTSPEPIDKEASQNKGKADLPLN